MHAHMHANMQDSCACVKVVNVEWYEMRRSHCLSDLGGLQSCRNGGRAGVLYQGSPDDREAMHPSSMSDLIWI